MYQGLNGERGWISVLIKGCDTRPLGGGVLLGEVSVEITGQINLSALHLYAVRSTHVSPVTSSVLSADY